MPKISQIIHRIIDANINRTKEGLRVCEEITRFMLESRGLTSKFKRIRHEIDEIVKKLPPKLTLLKARYSLKDIGKDIHINEFKRKDLLDLFFANMQRIKESVRVLEEFSKINDVNIALKLKRIRYHLYELEKKVTKRIAYLCHHR